MSSSIPPSNFSSMHMAALNAAKHGIDTTLRSNGLSGIDAEALSSFNPDWDVELSDLVAQAIASGTQVAEQPGI